MFLATTGGLSVPDLASGRLSTSVEWRAAVDALGQPLVFQGDLLQMFLDRDCRGFARQFPNPGRMPPVVVGRERRCRWRVLHVARGSIPFALEALAQHLAVAADRFQIFANPALRRFLVGAAPFHVPESALTLHFLLEHPQSGIDIVVAYEHLHRRDAFLVVAAL